MNCKDLMAMPQLRDGMKLIAGKEGLKNVVRWIYFADCIQCLSGSINPADLIHGEELVIVTDQKLTCDDTKIIGMIESLRQKNIAGFVINEGQISPGVIDYCNGVNLPLFELSLKLHLIDVSQLVCKALVEEESTANSREHILSSILYSETINTAEIIEQAAYFGIDLKGPHRVLQFSLFDDKSIKNPEEKDLIERREYIKKTVRNEFAGYSAQQSLVLIQVNTAIVLVPSEPFTKEALSKAVLSIVSKIKKHYPISLLAGIGTPYDYIEEFRISYREAQDAIRLCRITDKNQTIFFYENSGLYSLISQIHNDKILDEYVQSHIGKLIKSDDMQKGSLCRTLESYLDNNCNANLCAEKLNVHRNTMHYRLDKIKQILDTDLDSMSVLVELKLSFAIRLYQATRRIVPDAQ